MLQLPSLRNVYRVAFDTGASSVLELHDAAQENGLQTSTNAYFTLRNTTTGLTLPALQTYTTGTLALLPDTALTVGHPERRWTAWTIDFQGAGSVVAENLTPVQQRAQIELAPSRTFTTGGLSNIDCSGYLGHRGKNVWGRPPAISRQRRTMRR